MIARNDNWTNATPSAGGWYKYRKAGIERVYFLAPMVFTNPLLPDAPLLFAQDNPDSNSGKHIGCETNDEFIDCEWLGPLSGEPQIVAFESISL
jgi:hypothetical protein